MGADLQAMLADLYHPDSTIRGAAEQYFHSIGTPEIALLEEAVHHPDPRIAVSAVTALTLVGGPDGLDALAKVLTARNLLTADLALRSLERSGAKSVPVLLKALPGCQPMMQISIVTSLERIGSREAVRPLMALLAGTEWAALRYTIIQALGVLGDPAAADLIQSFEGDPDDHVRERVSTALKRLNQES